MGEKRLVFTGQQKVEVEEFEARPPGDGEVQVRTHYTVMSTGTENIVFNRLFAPGTHWDNWVKYPFYPGYSLVGVVEAVGKDVSTLVIGDRVALRDTHASVHTINAAHCIRIECAINSKDAAWFALAKIAFHGALAAEYKLGDSLLVIGAGPIGQMTVRWAKAAGVRDIIVVDPVGMRLDMALSGGATAVIAKGASECKDDVMAVLDGALPRVVNDATGHPDVFASALGLAAQYGRVVILGDTGTPGGQHLTSDVIMRGLTITGAHDGHNNDIWNNKTIAKYFFDLVLSGRFDVSGLITHSFCPEQAVDAYTVANTRRSETMGIQFAWV